MDAVQLFSNRGHCCFSTSFLKASPQGGQGGQGAGLPLIYDISNIYQKFGHNFPFTHLPETF